MSLLIVEKQYKNGTILTEAQLDAMRISIEDYLNKNGLTNDNIADQGLTMNDGTFADNGVLAAQIKTSTITTNKLSTMGQQLSSSSGSYSATTSTATDITNLSISITTTGRPVALMLVSDGTGSVANLDQAGGSNDTFDILFLRDATTLVSFRVNGGGGISQGGMAVPPGSFFFIDNKPSAATYTYKVQGNTNAAATALTVNNVKLLVWEL